MSYRKRHIKSKINRIKPKISTFKRLWFWIAILVSAVILILAYSALFYSGLQLKNVIILGNEKIKIQDLQNIVAKHTTTRLLSFLSVKIDSRSIFLINTKEISADILQGFSGIEKLTVVKNFPQTLILNITERKPVGAYCDNENKCFLIDYKGVVYETLPENAISVFIVRQPAGNVQVSIGQEVVAASTVDAITKIQKDLRDNFKIDLKEAVVASPVRLNIATNEKWKIYFDLGENADTNLQIDKLNLLLNGGMSATERNNLRYIDLRPKDRAIVCANSTCGTY